MVREYVWIVNNLFDVDFGNGNIDLFSFYADSLTGLIYAISIARISTIYDACTLFYAYQPVMSCSSIIKMKPFLNRLLWLESTVPKRHCRLYYSLFATSDVPTMTLPRVGE